MPQTFNTHAVAVAGAQLRGWSYQTYATPAALPVSVAFLCTLVSRSANSRSCW